MLSIIVTHKTNTNYLEDCLESIAEQNYPSLETILVLDHTQDDLQDLISEYSNSINLKVFELEDREGVSAARNYGLQKASGEFVTFLDNDDYLMPETVLGMMELFDDETDITYCEFKNTWFQKKAFNEEQVAEEEEDDEIEHFDFDNYFDYKIRQYKKLEKLSVLGMIYRKSLFTDNDILFNEDQKYYADARVLYALSRSARKIKCSEKGIYVKRFHNDKQNNPSLNQIEKEITMPYYFIAYDNAMKNAGDDIKYKNHLNFLLAKFITKPYLRKLRYKQEEWGDVWEKEYFEELKKRARDVNPKALRKKYFTRSEKKLVKVMGKSDFKTTYKQGLKVLARRKIVKMLTNKRIFNKTIALYIFSKMKFKENWIVFESFMGRNCSGQPKYIYQYLQKHYPGKYKCIWVVDRRGVKIPGKFTRCKRFGLRYFYYMNRSKYWVNNMRQPLSVPKRDETIILATWHGTPLKKLVFDMDDVHSATPQYKNMVFRQTREWDYLLSDNPFSTEKFQSCFLFEKEKILEAGYPANDPLYAEDKEKRANKIKEKLGIPKDKKVILYAPTWRDDNFFEAGQYGFDLDLDLARLQKEFGDEYVVLLRLHYFVVEKMDLSKYGDFTINGCDYDDITDLYLVSDILMTDYSSVFFDYANLERPILFFTYDIDKYRDVLRGFYLDMEKDLPGPLLPTNDDVVNAIKNIDSIKEQYKDRYKEFYDRFCCVDDGNAAKRVVETVFEGIK